MDIFRNVSAHSVSVGSSPVRLDTGAARSALMVAALTGDVYLKLGGQSAPTISATDYHRIAFSGDDALTLPFADGVPVWGWSATTTNVNVTEAGV